MIGRTFSHYTITEKLGEGGMGEVFLAMDTELKRSVVLKFLPESAAEDDEALARFKREAQTAAALNHPNIVTIHEIGRFERRPYIAMSHIDGDTVRDEIRTGVSRDRALDIVIQACRGLQKAHEAGIVHRDIKPENLISDSDGCVKIVDFGIATLSGPRGGEPEATSGGTVFYMSPEQAQGQKIDARSDIFSLGTILYEMLAGRRPFKGEHPSAVHYSIVNDDPEPLSRLLPKVDPRLERVVERALEKDPAKRYQSAAELAEDLEALRAGPGLPLLGPASLRRFLLPLVVGLAAVVALVIVNPFKDRTGSDIGMPAGENTLAIMYFDNKAQSGDPNRLGEIVTDLLITNFSQSDDVKVVSSQRLYDILKLRGKEDAKVIDQTTASGVAQAAGARWMMMGSILQVAPNLIITMQLIDVVTGNVEGSQRLTGAPGETVFSLVDRMTGEARSELDMPLPMDVEPPRPVADVTTNSLEAYRHYVQGRELANKLYYTDAMEEYREAIRLDSTFAMAHYRYAFAAMNSANFSGALAALRQATRYIDRVSEKERLYIEALSAITAARLEEGAARLTEITKRYPDEKEAFFTLASSHYQRGNVEEAIENYRKVLALDPLHASSYNMLAYAYNRIGEFEKSIQAIDRYIELCPGEANPLDSRGDLYAYNGDIDAAIDSYKKALDVKPDFYASMRKLGHMYLYQGRYDEAAARYRILTASGEPAIRSTGRSFLAALELYRGRFRDALSMIDNGLAADEMEGFRGDSYLGKLTMRAAAYKEIGDIERARDIGRGLMPLLKEAFPALTVALDLAVASFLAECGYPAQADSLVRLHESEVRNFDYGILAAYHNALGLIALRSNDAAGAVRHFEMVDSLVPDTYLTRYWLGTSYLEAGRVDDAISILETALQRYDDNRLADPAKAVRGIYVLGTAYERAGKNAQAVGQYRKFLDIWKNADPEPDEVPDARQRLARLGSRS